MRSLAVALKLLNRKLQSCKPFKFPIKLLKKKLTFIAFIMSDCLHNLGID